MAKRARRGQARDSGIDLARDPLAAAGRGLILLKMVLVVLLFDPVASDAFSLPKVVASRATTYLLIAVLVGLTLRYGIRVWRWSPIYLPAAAYVAINALAVPFALDRTLALFGAPIRLLGLTTLLDLFFTMVATATLIRTIADLRSFARAFFVTAVPVVGYAALQIAHVDPLHWADPRIFATFGNPAHLGAYLAIVGSAAIGTLAVTWRQLRMLERSALVVLALACAIALGPVGSRAPVGALLVGVSTATILSALRLRHLSAPMISGGIALAALTVIAVAASPLGDRFQALLVGGDPSREILWTAALQMFSAHPVLGIGPDNFAAAYPALRTLRAVQVVGLGFLESSPHSWVLQAVVSAGAGAVVVLIALTVYAAYRALRRMGTTPAAVPLLAGLAAFLTQAVVAPNEIALEVLFWQGLGLVVVLDHIEGARAADSSPRRGGTSAVVRWRRLDLQDSVAAVALVGAIVASALSWSPVRASEAHVAALANADAGNAAEALRLARASVDLDPSRAQYWAGLGRAQLLSGQENAALASFERAAMLAPYLSGHWRNLASTRLRLAAKDPSLLPRALDAARRAVAATPTDPLAYVSVAEILLAQGDRDGAIREAQRSLEIHPEETAFEVLGVTYGQMGRYAEAEAILRRGVDQVGGLYLRVLLSRVLFAEGRREEARPLLIFVLGYDPLNTDAQEMWRQLPDQK